VILLWGLPQEETLSSVYNALLTRTAETFFLDQRRALATRLRHTDEGVVLTLGSQQISLGDVTSVYPRPYPVPALTHRGSRSSHPAAERHVARLEAELWRWMTATRARVINHPTPAATNCTKPLQTQAAAACGFAVPTSLITNDVGALRAFARQHGVVVVKSAGGSRVFTQALDLTDAERLERLSTSPTYFQQYVAGRNVRVHVVGGLLFAVEVDATEIDYRKGTTEMRRIRLPAPVGSRCLQVTRQLGLVVAGLDLIHTGDEEWYFLEANPAPAFAFYPDRNDVAAAIADLLISPPNSCCLVPRSDWRTEVDTTRGL
jgi:hypothetical protein